MLRQLRQTLGMPHSVRSNLAVRCQCVTVAEEVEWVTRASTKEREAQTDPSLSVKRGRQFWAVVVGETVSQNPNLCDNRYEPQRHEPPGGNSVRDR